MCTQHYVYAVIRSSRGLEKVKVSGPLSWGAAQDRWSLLDDIRFGGGYVEVLATPVSHFSVRAGDDPTWPRRAYPRHVLIRNESGEFVSL